MTHAILCPIQTSINNSENCSCGVPSDNPRDTSQCAKANQYKPESKKKKTLFPIRSETGCETCYCRMLHFEGNQEVT